MKVYTAVTSKLSVAMDRVADALVRYRPYGVSLARSPEEADVQVLHVIGDDENDIRAKDYAVIQYCWATAGNAGAFDSLWQRARLVTSYYDLERHAENIGASFVRLPLGVDGDTFRMREWSLSPRDQIVTSGYVSGPKAEAIEEVADAALRTGTRVMHLGPADVEGMAPRTERTWQAFLGVDDETLAAVYQDSRYVSGLRRVEGFELPALEGLACGARPILFDREDARHWYGEHGVYVPEVGAEELTNILVDVFRGPWREVTRPERDNVVRKYSWVNFARRFWEECL